MASSVVFLLAFSLLIPSSISQCTVSKALPYFRRSVYEFSVDLVKRIAEETDNHFITSALSSWTILSAISLGAADETYDEIRQVLRLHPHKCFNWKYYEIIQLLTGKSDGVTLERSSTIFVDDRMTLKKAFKNKVKKTKVTEIEEILFDDFIAVANIINDYVSRATHGTIDEIVESSQLEGAFVILIDALYFKGSWQKKFSSEDTEISAFYDERGNQIGDVNLMFSTQESNFTSVSQIGASVLELPYGSSGRFSMLFILPDTGKTISSVLDSLKTISLSSIFNLFSQSGLQDVMIQIPRFKIDSDLDNMKEWLSDMGLRSMFDSTLAKLSTYNMSEYSLYVSDLVQKAAVEVTEEGTEASAASGAAISGRLLSTSQFTANKPFLFMIVDKELQLALFTGAYSKPSVY